MHVGHDRHVFDFIANVHIAEYLHPSSFIKNKNIFHYPAAFIINPPVDHADQIETFIFSDMVDCLPNCVFILLPEMNFFIGRF